MYRFMFPVALSVIFLNAPVSAQSIWLPHGENHTVGIEFLKPDFDGDANVDFFTGALFLTGKLRVSEKLFFVAELPIVRRGFDEEFGFFESETAVGNPYIGLETRGETSFIEFGLRPPLMSDDDFIAASAAIADFDRLEAFDPDFFTIAAKVNYRKKSASDLVTRLRLGPTFLIYTNDTGDDLELLLDYSAQVGYEGGQVHVIGGLTGRFLASSDDGNIGERTVHQLGVAANLALNNVRPGIHLRLPIDDDLNNIIDLVFGLHLAVLLK